MTQTTTTKLFTFLTYKIVECIFPLGKLVYIYITSSERLASVGPNNPVMPDCNHEDADTRVIGHILYALARGMKEFEI